MGGYQVNAGVAFIDPSASLGMTQGGRQIVESRKKGMY
jgi:hypothetical protein